MSRYATSKVLWQITRDRDLAAQFRDHPATVLQGLDLTPDERAALTSQDLRRLLGLGVHPFVLYHFALRMEGHISLEFMRRYLAELDGLTVGNLET